jgi:hypothetical protein
MPINKVEMSLDDIIKVNKKKEQAGKGNNRNKPANKNTNARRRTGGIAKKPSQNQPKKTAVTRRNTRTRAVGRPLNRKSGPPQKIPAVSATKKLVNKLVKKALAQTTVGRRQPLARNVIRRGGARLPRRSGVLNRISNKSRIIRRMPTLPAVSPVAPIARGRGQIRFPAVQANVVRRVGGARRTFARRIPQQQQQFVRRAVNVIPQNSIRGQISALRRQQQPVQQRVVFAPPPRRQQQVVYVQAPPRKQFVVQQPRRQQQQGFRQQQRNNFRRNNARNNNNNNGAFFDPPNFLQRVPAQAQVRRVRY